MNDHVTYNLNLCLSNLRNLLFQNNMLLNINIFIALKLKEFTSLKLNTT